MRPKLFTLCNSVRYKAFKEERQKASHGNQPHVLFSYATLRCHHPHISCYLASSINSTICMNDRLLDTVFSSEKFHIETAKPKHTNSKEKKQHATEESDHQWYLRWQQPLLKSVSPAIHHPCLCCVYHLLRFISFLLHSVVVMSAFLMPSVQVFWLTITNMHRPFGCWWSRG